MPKLHELIKFRNDLLEISDQFVLKDSIDLKIGTLQTTQFMATEINYSLDISALVDYYNHILTKDEQIINLIDSTVKQLDSDINNIVQTTLYNVDYYKRFSYDSRLVNQTLGNFIPLDTEIKSVLRAKIHHYGDWRYPALLMGCRSVDWIDAMVQYDPLYLSNYDLKDTVNTLISSYTEIYQRRLRIYSISNHDYSILPQNQFGVIVALDYLNYITASDIEKCLGEVYNMLRPGGVFVFSYNNCDIPINAELAENGVMSYYSAQQLKIIAKHLGFEIIQLDDIPISHDDYPYISTAELRRPGKLQSIRLNQVLGRIGHK